MKIKFKPTNYIILFGSLISILLFLNIREDTSNLNLLKFNNEAEAIVYELIKELEHELDVLTAFNGLYSASETVSREEFQIFANTIFDIRTEANQACESKSGHPYIR